MVTYGGAGAVSAAEIILYDRFNFQGDSVTLTESASDLRDYNFDNDLESFRVISGTWRIFRDANYQSNNGPSLTVGPGSYPDIRELRDNEDVRYPRNRMSSVRLILDPVAASCPPPYQTPNPDGVACTFVCASGTVPDRASGECVCQRGWAEVGADNQGRRICRPQERPQPEDPVIFEPPLLPRALWVQTTAFDMQERARVTVDPKVTLDAIVATSDQLAEARLMYRAIEGPRVIGNAAMLQLLTNAPWLAYRDQGARRPMTVGIQLSAGAAVKWVYFQVRAQTMGASGGAWIASAPAADNILYEPVAVEAPRRQEYVVSGLLAVSMAQSRGFRFSIVETVSNFNSDCILAGPIATARYGPTPTSSFAIPVVCDWTLFAGRDLADGWRMIGMTFRGTGIGGVSRSDVAGLDLPVKVSFQAGLRDPATTALMLYSVRLEGPAGRAWQEAFLCRGRCPD